MSECLCLFAGHCILDHQECTIEGVFLVMLQYSKYWEGKSHTFHTVLVIWRDYIQFDSHRIFDFSSQLAYSWFFVKFKTTCIVYIIIMFTVLATVCNQCWWQWVYITISMLHGKALHIVLTTLDQDSLRKEFSICHGRSWLQSEEGACFYRELYVQLQNLH